MPEAESIGGIANNFGTIVGAGIAVVFGTMLADLPFWTGGWIILGLLPIYAVSKFWDRIGRKYQLYLPSLAVLWAILAGAKAYEEYAGANYRLKYRACAAVTLDGGGRFDVAFFGLEFVNDNGIDLFLRQQEDKILTVDDRNSTTTLLPATVVVKQSGAPEDDGKITDWVQLDPPLPPRELKGYARYTFKYGRDRDELTNTLVVEGIITVPSSDDGTITKARFSPTGDTGYIGVCDTGMHMYGQQTQLSAL